MSVCVLLADTTDITPCDWRHWTSHDIRHSVQHLS